MLLLPTDCRPVVTLTFDKSYTWRFESFRSIWYSWPSFVMMWKLRRCALIVKVYFVHTAGKNEYCKVSTFEQGPAPTKAIATLLLEKREGDFDDLTGSTPPRFSFCQMLLSPLVYGRLFWPAIQGPALITDNAFLLFVENLGNNALPL